MDLTFSSIPDSTDWLSTPLACVAPLESALRCQVCKDFFNNPVITSCSHTFCSLCIRRCLSAEGKCPACRAPDQELKLRRNGAVQELVDCFQAARGKILDLSRKSAEEGEEAASARRIGATGALASNTDLQRGGTIDVGLDGHLNDTDLPAAKKRRLDPPPQYNNDISPPGTPSTLDDRRTTRSQGRRNDVQRPSISVNATEVIEDSEEEDFVPEDGLVACPICNRRMKNEAVFSHLDSCQGPQGMTKVRQSKGASQLSSLFPSNHISISSTDPKRPERLPGLNYSILKENVLRKKFRDLGIPDWGPRTLLQRRHTEWMNLWNANCDAKAPKSKKELLRELDVWERTQGGLAQAQSGTQAGSASSVMRKDFDATAWSVSHGDDFKRLIDNARKKVGAAKQPATSRMDPESEQEEDRTDIPKDLNGGDGVNTIRELNNESTEDSLASQRSESAVGQIRDPHGQAKSSSEGGVLEAPVL